MLRLLREAAATAWSQKVMSGLSVALIAALVFAVMLTTGRSVGAEESILESMDSVGSRSIIVRAEPDAELTSDVLHRIANLNGIEWAIALSPATDAVNDRHPEGSKVPVRMAYGDDMSYLGVGDNVTELVDVAWGSEQAIEALGLADGVGIITLTDTRSYSVLPGIVTPDMMDSFEPLLVVPAETNTAAEPISILIVVADEPESVAATSKALLSVLSVSDTSKITVENSEIFAELRVAFQNQFSAFSHGLLIAMLVITAVIEASLLFALVLMRRKDFGRRRALGASRSYIIRLLLLQTVLLSLIGYAVGVLASMATLRFSGAPTPGATFIVALGILILIISAVAAFPPAYLASRREPIKELRIA